MQYERLSPPSPMTGMWKEWWGKNKFQIQQHKQMYNPSSVLSEFQCIWTAHSLTPSHFYQRLFTRHVPLHSCSLLQQTALVHAFSKSWAFCGRLRFTLNESCILLWDSMKGNHLFHRLSCQVGFSKTMEDSTNICLVFCMLTKPASHE